MLTTITNTSKKVYKHSQIEMYLTSYTHKTKFYVTQDTQISRYNSTTVRSYGFIQITFLPVTRFFGGHVHVTSHTHKPLETCFNILPIHTCLVIFLPIHIKFYPSKWLVDRSSHTAMMLHAHSEHTHARTHACMHARTHTHTHLFDLLHDINHFRGHIVEVKVEPQRLPL